jgi:hypothetical protein
LKITIEHKLLADLSVEYVGITQIESWEKIDGSRGYRYTDASDAVYPVWTIGPDTQSVIQAFRVVLDANARTIANENAKKKTTRYIVSKKSNL